MATLFPEDVLLGVEAGFPTAAQQKVSTNATEKAGPPKRTTAHSSHEKMVSPSARSVMLGMVFLVMAFMTLATAVTNMDLRPKLCAETEHQGLAPPSMDTDESSFSRLLDSVSPESLHDLLHRYFPNTYRHGVYPDDQAALEAVHRANAPLATTLVKMAKRQGTPSNSTTTPPPDTSTTTETPPPPTSTETTPPDLTIDGSTTTEGPSTLSEPTSTSPSDNTKTPSKSLRPVTSTFTSTDTNGKPTVVTATSYVLEGPPTSTKPGGSLQTDAAALHNSGLFFKVFTGVLVGGVLLA